MSVLIFIIKWGGDYFYFYAWVFVIIISLVSQTFVLNICVDFENSDEPLYAR